MTVTKPTLFMKDAPATKLFEVVSEDPGGNKSRVGFSIYCGGKKYHVWLDRLGYIGLDPNTTEVRLLPSGTLIQMEV